MKSYKLYDENRMEVQRELAISLGFRFSSGCLLHHSRKPWGQDG